MRKPLILRWFLLACLLKTVNAIAGAAAIPPERGPYGFFPAKLAVQTNADNLTLRLTGTVSGVNYLVLVRTNKLYARWLLFTNILGFPNTNVSSIQISLNSGKTNLPSIRCGLQRIPASVLSQMQFTAGSGEDADGDNLPDLYEDLVTRTDPLSPDTGNTGMPDGYKDLVGDGWCNLGEMYSGIDPLHWTEPPPPSNVVINNAPGGGLIMCWQYQASTMPESFTVFRKAKSAPDAAWQCTAVVKAVFDKYHEFEYVETNANALRLFAYSVCANYPAPEPWVAHALADKDGIRQTIRQVTFQRAGDGYELTVANMPPHARYLMLARDSTNGFWKASGFFIGGTNGMPMKLFADSRGMLTKMEGPLLLPKVEHIPNLEQPGFICGSGEDADGDGLPDIYEVLATKTDPDSSDTGGTGLLDGYKDLAGDGWTVLEKYRRRADPFAKVEPPAGIEIITPTLGIVSQAIETLEEESQSDFKYEVAVETRRLQQSKYQPLQKPWETLFPQMRRDDVATNLAVHIFLRMPERKAPSRDAGGGP